MDQPLVDLAIAKTRLRTRLEGEAGAWLREHALATAGIAFTTGLVAGRSAQGEAHLPELIRGLGVVLGQAFVPREPGSRKEDS